MRSTASGLLRSPQLFCEIESSLTGKRIGTLTCFPVAGSLWLTLSGMMYSKRSHAVPLAGMPHENELVLASTNFISMPQDFSLPLRDQPVILTTFPGSVLALGWALQPPKERTP